MKLALKIITSLLLIFNSVGAIYGGGNLILHPDGSSIRLSLDWLQHTPFPDYMIPGIILLEVNGIFGIFVLINLLFNQKIFPQLVMAQGILLGGWIIVQMILIRTIYFLHILLGLVGLALIILGWNFIRMQKELHHAR